MVNVDCRVIEDRLRAGVALSGAETSHVQNCPRCGRMLARLGPIPELSALREPAPEGLEAQIFARIEQAAGEATQGPEGPAATNNHRVTRRRLLGAVLGLAASAALAHHWRRGAPARRAEELLDLMIADHLRYRGRLDQVHIASSDSNVVQEWLRGRLRTAARVLDLEAADLLGARHCRLAQLDAGLIFYRIASGQENEHMGSLYVFHEPDADFSRMEVLAASADRRICRRQALGLSAAIWDERGLTYTLVSELDDAALGELLGHV